MNTATSVISDAIKIHSRDSFYHKRKKDFSRYFYNTAKKDIHLKTGSNRHLIGLSSWDDLIEIDLCLDCRRISIDNWNDLEAKEENCTQLSKESYGVFVALPSVGSFNLLAKGVLFRSSTASSNVAAGIR